jgi:hypothetical protein
VPAADEKQLGHTLAQCAEWLIRYGGTAAYWAIACRTAVTATGVISNLVFGLPTGPLLALRALPSLLLLVLSLDEWATQAQLDACPALTSALKISCLRIWLGLGKWAADRPLDVCRQLLLLAQSKVRPAWATTPCAPVPARAAAASTHRPHPCC